ncbi:MAG: hypothetical protein U5L72_01415 [Bacteroidales bacterium]|nr:hypothetical protein [Bacteroidales bacterium]
MVIMDARVATVDADFSFAEAVAVKGDIITFVGTNGEVEQFIGPETNVLKLGGKLVLPGLIDAHGHLHSLGEQLANLDINGASSYEEIMSSLPKGSKPFSRANGLLADAGIRTSGL